MVVYYDEDNFSIKLYRNCVSGELVDLIEVIPIDELLEVWADRKTEPQTDNPCDGCVCDDGKHLMYCMNCKGIAWKTEPPRVEDKPFRAVWFDDDHNEIGTP